MNKLSKIQLRRLIEGEAKRIEHQSISIEQKNTKMVAEGLGSMVANLPKYAKQSADVLSSAGAFIKGVRKFLKDNEDWIDPLWEMLKDMKSERGDQDVMSGEVIDIDSGSSDDFEVDDMDIDSFSMSDMIPGDSDGDSSFDIGNNDFIIDSDELIAEANRLYNRHISSR